ncbi:class I tRNA ligase family protein [Planctomicrobium piriforme]|uniref:Ferric uptake regulator family protein n=1 Tax=Planctomicrobium piriforme TaxID=1576369 RepID=A0A1I3K9R5_9PLAN|nr:class I tRNA ligase family protein [Planctomicrobium piriforme]SFI68955.1 Ferric uptake regulator family protein [Planctomicrobium piriforme]
MFQKVDDARFLSGEHDVLRFWSEHNVFRRLQEKNRGKKKWSFLDGPITANNPMGVHHAWGRTYKDVFQRYRAMTGHELRYQNGFDCQGLWVEVEVEKQLKLGTKKAIEQFGIDVFTRECKKRVLKFAARQTEQSIRLGYWMEWDQPEELRKLAEGIEGLEARGQGEIHCLTSTDALDARHPAHDSVVSYTTARGQEVTGPAEAITAKLGNPEWGGSYFTFSTENNETIWTFLKKCFNRKKIYRGHDVMPWSGRGGSAYSQMEVADGRKLTTHRACFVRFPLVVDKEDGTTEARRHGEEGLKEYLLIWTTTPWTLTANVAAAINPEMQYVQLKAKIKGDDEPAIYYFAEENLYYKRLEKEFKEGFGRPEWGWPEGAGKLKSLGQIFKELTGTKELDTVGTIDGKDMIGWRYAGPFDDLPAQIASPSEKDRAENKIHKRYNNFEKIILATLQHLKDEGPVTAKQILEASKEIGLSTWQLRAEASIRKYFERLDHMLVLVDANIQPISSSSDNLIAKKVSIGLRNLGVGSSISKHFLATSSRGLSFSENFPSVEDLVEVIEAQPKIYQRISEEISRISTRSGVAAHRVIDGGRDFKGNANVVAGEGTGIVHIAPGCGDVDHKMGVELGLPVIAPLGEDGRYLDGFGAFTGKEATDPATVDLVFEQLKLKNLLVSVETYPHIYPFCWRTGDELVFRLVDEWFINMDWRDEIKEVTKCINWIPDSIQGQERELEWLTTMRDWMISKKRFWGLALPIWINPNDPTDFEVVGSLAELKARALDGGEGWEEFEAGGYTPHRPWIDNVKFKSQKTGAMLSRIEDVGNPWLDAGIVPFSTLNYKGSRVSSDECPVPEKGNGHSLSQLKVDSSLALDTGHSTLDWSDWFPADFVTECFPGQFRNWFYSLLSLATMMRSDETDDPNEKRPFKNLLGHRLVMNEEGKPMHKSDGTAIWFEEAAEQLGVDTLRWLYLAQNPAVDLRFGTRHGNQHVTLETADGPISETKEGLKTCKVTSKPADEVRRQALIPLWNSYAFFVNYAILDGFDPSLPQVPVSERPEIDRWVLSRLQELTQTAHDSFQNYRVADFMSAAAEFIDDLSNWYIRRNRRRFWAVKSPVSSVESPEPEKATETRASARRHKAVIVSPAMATAELLYRKVLSDKDLKMTQERTVVIHEIFSTEDTFSPEQLVARLSRSEAGKRVSRSTIYRSLKHLEEAGLLEVLSRSDEAEGPGSVTSYRPSLPAIDPLANASGSDEQAAVSDQPSADSFLKTQASSPTPLSAAETVFRAYLAERKQGLNRERGTLLKEVFSSTDSFTVEGLLVRLSRYHEGKKLHRKDVQRGVAQLVEAGLLSMDREVYHPVPPVVPEQSAVSSQQSANAESSSLNAESWPSDKLAAYQTLYEVLLTTTKLLAPCIPFLTERMYRNLVQCRVSSVESQTGSPASSVECRVQKAKTDVATPAPDTGHWTLDTPLSVHLCDYPEVDPAKLDLDLNWKTHQVQALVRMAHRLRETAELRVRQPLAELRFATNDPKQAAALEQYADIIADELNVKQVVRSEHLDELVSYSFKPNLKTLGPKYGKLLNVIRTGLASVDPKLMAPLRSGESVTLTLEGNELTLAPEDVMVSVQQASDWASADDAGIQIALSTKLTPELVAEGMARDLIRQIQQLRKDADLEENQRIAVQWSPAGHSAVVNVQSVISQWEKTICAETRADTIEHVETAPLNGKNVSLGDVDVVLAISAV